LNNIEIVSDVMLAINLINAVTVLSMQVAAYRRHHHQSFLLLSLSTVIALLATMTMATPLFIPSAFPLAASIFIAGACLQFCYAVLGIWGVASLFRSYDALRQGV
jgi:tellurite resistance protein TehA-like permease